jgi:hypothetical protein
MSTVVETSRFLSISLPAAPYSLLRKRESFLAHLKTFAGEPNKSTHCRKANFCHRQNSLLALKALFGLLALLNSFFHLSHKKTRTSIA